MRFLWMLDMGSRGRVASHKVAGKEDPFDLLANGFCFADAQRLLGHICVRFLEQPRLP